MTSHNINNDSNEPYFELNDFYLVLVRNKNLIGKILFIAITLGSFYSLIKKPVWQGEFQIVLRSDQPSLPNLNIGDPILMNAFGISSPIKSKIKTDVEILKSSSVLNPSFLYVKKEREKQGINTKKLTYNKWLKKNLNIFLTRDTSVLNLSYRDKDKDLVLEVLKKISNSYQEYAGLNKRKSLSINLKFQNKQVDIYKKRASESFKKVQNFALENDLIPIKLEKSKDKSRIDIDSTTNTFGENLIIQAKNQIRKIDSQLDFIDSLEENEYEKVIFIAKTIPEITLTKQIDTLEADLLKKRTIYTDKDLSVVSLIKQRKAAINLLKFQTYQYLKSEKQNLEEQILSNTRPKDVLIKYKLLLAESFRDEKTLSNLQTQLILLALEDQKSQKPWELITEPTLNEDRYSPKRKKIVLLSAILGLLVSTITAFIKEKKNDIIFSFKFLQHEIQKPYLISINSNDQKDMNEASFFLSKYLNEISIKKSLAFINIGTIDDSKLNAFSKSLSSFTKGTSVAFSSNILENENFENYILVLNLGGVTKANLRKKIRKIELSKRNVVGWILID